MTFLAHGGTAGLIAETTLGVLVAALLFGVWLRERRRRARGLRPPKAQMRD